jgi:hypothetical protein
VLSTLRSVLLRRAGIILGGSLISLFLGMTASTKSAFTVFSLLCFAGMLALLVWSLVALVSFISFVFFVFQDRKASVGELVVDRSGLTVQRRPMGVHLPWRDIAQVGVLQLNRRSLNPRLPADRYMWKPVLVVRLRPENPNPNVLSVLSDEHWQLGYLGLCTLESVGASHQEMISALERFVGGKLVHSSRQFLDRDPRLRPEMV